MTINDLKGCFIKDIDQKFSGRIIERIIINTNDALSSDNEGFTKLFFCIKGAKYDSHKDIPKLIEAGITDIVVQYIPQDVVIPDNVNIIMSENTRITLALASKIYFGFPDETLTMIGITGTKGKTTISYMIEGALRESGIKCGIIGTNGVIFDGGRYECDNSTPGAYEYYRYLRKMADSGVTHVICEVTSQALKQYRTYGTIFDIAAFTNLSEDHIGKDEHTDFDDYRQCKGLLFQNCRKAVLNKDDDEYRYFSDICRRFAVDMSFFSIKERKADYYCTGIKSKCLYTKFRYNGKRAVVGLPGDFNVQNAMCAISILKELGIKDRYIRKGISAVKVPGRCESVPNPAGVNIIIDYAHTGKSLENILSALKKNCYGKLYCVFGAGGDRSHLRRASMGEAASRYADYSIITSDNPRSEDPASIIDDIIKGIPSDHTNHTVIVDREKAIYEALAMAKKGDTVLLAGKGTQTYQEVCGIKYPFDEREKVSQYYNNLIIQR